MRKRIDRRTIIVVLVGLITVVLAAAWPRERLLLSQARPVVGVNNSDNSEYFWLSDQEVLLLRYRADGDLFEFVRVNIETRAETPLAPINHKYRTALTSWTLAGINNQPFKHIYRSPPDCRLSLDRQRLLWSPAFSHSDNIVITLNGLQERRWKRDKYSYSLPIWLHDSRHWIEQAKSTSANNLSDIKLILHDCQKGGREISMPVPPMSLPYLIGSTVNDRALYLDWKYETYSTAAMIEQNLTGTNSAFEKRTIRLPFPAHIHNVVISPRGDRLAWLLEYKFPSLLDAWLPRAIPSYNVQPRSLFGIWISRLDGSEMTEMGHLAIPPNSPSDPISNYKPLNLQWLPDEKHLSFVYKDSIWVVPAP